jgi:hypothetical protein
MCLVMCLFCGLMLRRVSNDISLGPDRNQRFPYLIFEHKYCGVGTTYIYIVYVYALGMSKKLMKLTMATFEKEYFGNCWKL